jgi:pimeloyl-ACP methyl ester carboxylesterase
LTVLQRSIGSFVGRCDARKELSMPRHHLPADFYDIFPQTLFSGHQPVRRSASQYAPVAAAAIGLMVGAALVNRYLAKKAERDNPPAGRFLDVQGVRLHYVERGSGEPLVLLHGNGSMIQDFGSSGLISMASEKYRVIAFDRPGFGHSSRPRSRMWTPQAQADLIHEALQQMGIERAVVLGHSWGASVAAALALRHPEAVSGLVLASGYYFPSVRADVVMLSGPAVPILGDIVSHTLAPLISRAIWPLLMRKIFGPAPIPRKFSGFPKAMAVRPSQIRASAEETAYMIPNAIVEREEYRALKMPVAIIAGQEDRLIPFDEQSARLHKEIAQSSLHRVPGAGHMVHQTAPLAVMSAIEQVDGSASRRRPEQRRVM